jgi:hypothetical protein
MHGGQLVTRLSGGRMLTSVGDKQNGRNGLRLFVRRIVVAVLAAASVAVLLLLTSQFVGL